MNGDPAPERRENSPTAAPRSACRSAQAIVEQALSIAWASWHPPALWSKWAISLHCSRIARVLYDRHAGSPQSTRSPPIFAWWKLSMWGPV